MRTAVLLVSGMLILSSASAQGQPELSSPNRVEAGIVIGKAISPSVAYFHHWSIGKKDRFQIGLGLRYTVTAGKDLYFITAPARITSGKTGPGVLFTENITANIDSLQLSRPQTHALNGALELGYQISGRFYAAFNIDLLGFSFGKKQSNGIYIREGNSTGMVAAKPAGFNLLLISDNDLGSLNSSLQLRYRLKPRWAVGAGLGFVFSEYKTAQKVQQIPEANDRFRYKSAGVLLSLTRFLK